MKSYTKTGDTGKTSLWDGQRDDKSDDIIMLLGEMDELSVRIGTLCIEIKLLGDKNDVDLNDVVVFLRKIQRIIQDMNTHMASPTKDPSKLPNIDSSIVNDMESLIDIYTDKLPKLTSFIIPCQNRADAACHMCRVQARKSERYLVNCMSSKLSNINPSIQIILNRMSDYFFTLSRMLQNN